MNSNQMLQIQSIKRKIRSLVSDGVLPYSILENRYFYRASDSKKLLKMKNIHKGERCFIIGNGPSLNKIDLVKLNNEYTFGVNGIFYKSDECGFVPYYYVIEDSHVIQDNIQRVIEYSGKVNFFPKNYRHLLRGKKNVIYFNMNTGFYEPESPNFKIPRFSTDISKVVYCGQSVTMINLQLAYYMGFKEVYLVGMDFSYSIPASAEVDGNNILSKEDDVNHFHPEYFGKGKSWHDPHLDRVLESYKYIKQVYEISGRKIYNATVGGNLEIFERADINKVIS